MVFVDGGGPAIGRRAAVNVVDRAGSAMIIGCSKAGAHDTVAYPTGRRGHGRRSTADLIGDAISAVCPIRSTAPTGPGYRYEK